MTFKTVISVNITDQIPLQSFFINRDVIGSNIEEPRLTAVGWLVGSVHTVIVPVAHPHPWDTALTDGTLELVGGTCNFSCNRDTQFRPFTPYQQIKINFF